MTREANGLDEGLLQVSWSHPLKLRFADAITFLRVVLAPIIFMNIVSMRTTLSLAFYVIALVTDVLDGVVARGTNSASPSGAFIDVSADFLLAISGLAGCMILGKISLRVIVVSLLVFAQFVAGHGRSIVYDPFGRLFGMLVILCTPIILMGPSFSGHLVDSSILFLGFLSLLGRFIYLGKAPPVRFHQLVSPDE